MEATARRKVPGGKLLAVSLEHDGHRITAVELSGDFFLHPEESIMAIESSLAGVPVFVSEGELFSIIDGVMNRKGIVALGFDPQDLASIIREALG